MTLKLLILLNLTCLFPFLIKADNIPVVCFETDSLIIKSDTASLFQLIEQTLSQEWITLIKSEVRYRLNNSKDNEAKMDGMTLHCYDGIQRNTIHPWCLDEERILTLIQQGKAKVYYKYPTIEICSIQIKKIGSKFRGKIERLYIDKSTKKIFFREIIYNNQWWKRRTPDCILPQWIKK